MTTRREFVGTVGAAAAAFVPLNIIDFQPFDVSTMETYAYPLSTPVQRLYNGIGSASFKGPYPGFDYTFTQRVVDYLQKESIDAYLVNSPSVMIAGSPHLVKARKLKCRVDIDFGEPPCADVPHNIINPEYFHADGKYDYIAEGVANEFAWEIRERAKGSDQFGGEPKSVGIYEFLMTPMICDPDIFCSRRGVLVRYLTSTTPAREILRLADLTRRANGRLFL